MTFRLSEPELDSYMRRLRENLLRVARRLAPPSQSHLGHSAEDAVQSVLCQICDFLTCGTALKPFERYNAPILTLDDLSKYARRRLRTEFGSSKKAGQRDQKDLTSIAQDLAARSPSAPPPQEHDIYDKRFFDDLTRALEKDELAYKIATLMIHCQTVPDTEDLNICDNRAIAKKLGGEVTELDVRLARNRIHTIKNRLIAARNPQDEGPKA